MEHPVSTMPMRQQKRVYLEEEWEAQRITFTELYQSYTLKQAMEIMERDHGFYATERQYKRRINKWELEKNIKRAEMLQIIQEKMQRKAIAGKDSAFHVRKRKVGEGKISRAEKRTKLLPSELQQVIDGVALDMAAGITCHTPEPKENLNLFLQLMQLPMSVEDVDMTMNIDAEPFTYNKSGHVLHRQDRPASLAARIVLDNVIPELTAPTPSRFLIELNGTNRTLRDIDIRTTTPPLSNIALEHVADNFDNVYFVESSDVDAGSTFQLELPVLKPLLAFGSAFGSGFRLHELEQSNPGFGSSHSTREFDGPDQNSNKSPYEPEREYDQILINVMDKFGPAHPQVLDTAIQFSLTLVCQRRYKYVSEILLPLVEARRFLIKSIDEDTIEAIDTLVSVFRPESRESRLDQFLSMLIESFLPASLTASGAIIDRVNHLRAEILTIDRVRKVATEHKQLVKYHRSDITARGELRMLNSICLAVDELTSSATAAALITRGFRLRAQGIEANRDIHRGTSLDMGEKSQVVFRLKRGDFEFSMVY